MRGNEREGKARHEPRKNQEEGNITHRKGRKGRDEWQRIGRDCRHSVGAVHPL